MTANRKLLWTLVMLVVVTLALSPMAIAKDGGKYKIHRDARELGSGWPQTTFGSPAADSCSGSCSCSFCSCYGTSSCCDAGCDACWDYRDSQGLCGNAT